MLWLWCQISSLRVVFFMVMVSGVSSVGGVVVGVIVIWSLEMFRVVLCPCSWRCWLRAWRMVVIVSAIGLQRYGYEVVWDYL